MRTRLALDLGAWERYIIAQYYGRSGRANRAEVRRFVAAAVESQARQWATGFAGRARATADRLRAARETPAPETVDSRDGLQQPRLF